MGSPEKPLTAAQLEAKFRDCARNAASALPQAVVDSTLAAIASLEMLGDSRELVAPFG